MKYARFDGMTWPLPDDKLEWSLRHLTGQHSRAAVLRAAEILAAYDALISAPERKRRVVVREIRKAMDKERES